MEKQRLLSFKEVKKEYGATISFWRTRIWSRDIPYVRVGNKILIDRKDIDDFIQKNKKTA
ncbi:MAG: helix-turn-helix domain-containing protein [Desulfobacterales bacterium]|nr:helix-turn-helix domain-containing protein [Desulfobacterales bacterium]